MYYYNSNDNAGLPYYDINWFDVEGQPFGIASYFNAIIFGDANNIVDTKGAMAVGGDFVSSRGLSLAYGNDGNLTGTGYDPDLVRFLVGGSVAMQGPLVVIGHVMAGGNFKAARGSTYMIGKDGSEDQAEEIMSLYSSSGGSKYWSLSDRGTHYAVSSYDVPRYIPASRVNADVNAFFSEAEDSINNYYECITRLQPNGTVTEHFHEWILKGNDPEQNVFLIDVRPNGVLNKEIHFEIPRGSLAVVILRTGNRAHIQYGLWGDKNNVNNTLYVFEDADEIFMEVPAAIWGSILAPQAMFHAHPTGGNVNGNAALASLAVNPGSGFEFHLYPFTGGVVCETQQQAPSPSVPIQIPEEAPQMPEEAPQMPEILPEMPEVEVPQIVLPTPCPACPPAQSCPEAEPCKEAPPCPDCPETPPCPNCPEAPPCPKCPEEKPCPSCPETKPCPPCPTCPEVIPPKECPVLIQPIPIPIPLPCPEEEKCEECQIKPGVIYGCIWGCHCCCSHEWEIRLYKSCGDKKSLLYCIKIDSCGCFHFEVKFDDFYLLEICPIVKTSHKHNRRKEMCKPVITLKNVGVANLMIEYQK